jgi:hypothetical protein
MYDRLLGSFVTACLVAAALTQSASAEYRKVGADKRSTAKVAEDECTAQSVGSSQVIAGQIIGGLIGMAVARDMYVKDCMGDRGYQWHSQNKPAKPKTKAN